ncbi:hypothetical protein diail_7465 [Diaporthe ilicicola]|nr:hypothetical protein diail_7465 [Diaporthe ilicicola]
MRTNAGQSVFIFDESEAEVEFGRPSTTAFVEKADKFLLSEEQSQDLSAAFRSASVWRRVWTMQELSHAPYVVLVAGSYQLDWAVVTAFLGEKPYADAFHALFGHGQTAKALDRNLGGAQGVDHQRRIMRESSYESKLLDVLARFQSNHATDPRDLI